jgi:hypothetical protein
MNSWDHYEKSSSHDEKSSKDHSLSKKNEVPNYNDYNDD